MSIDHSAEHEKLERTIGQQEMLAEFGAQALRSRDIDLLFKSAVSLCAEGMPAPLCKLLKYRPETEDFLVIAGIGWHEGVVGHATIGADMASPAGYAMKTGLPVISNHLQLETRFRTPDLMVEHGVTRAANVLISVSGENFGVLEVDSPDQGEFGKADLSFLVGFANLIGVAIERQIAETKLQQAIQYQELLTREASHRVKNSLAMVTSLIALQSGRTDNEEIRSALRNTQARILAIAQAHDQLWRHDQVGMVSLSNLLESVCRWLQDQNENVTLNLTCDEIDADADQGIPIGLMITELVTNALKYAYPETGGIVDVSVTADERFITLRVTDYGKGVPPGWSFSKGRANSLGGQLITSLTQQLGGELTTESDRGLSVIITIPRS